MTRANETQVGGAHYKARIQHWDFVLHNGLGYLEGCATKYISRSRKKHESPAQDLRKAVHYLQKLEEAFRAGTVKPRTNPLRGLPLPVSGFAKENGLTDQERLAVELVTFWETEQDLQKVVLLLETMIDETPAPISHS
jgi:hypothetical protein